MRRSLMLAFFLASTLLRSPSPAEESARRMSLFRAQHAETASERQAYTRLSAEPHPGDGGVWGMHNTWRNARKWIGEQNGEAMAGLTRFPLPDAGELLGPDFPRALPRAAFVEHFARIFDDRVWPVAMRIDENTLELSPDGTFDVLIHTEDEFTLILRFRCYRDECFLERLNGAG